MTDTEDPPSVWPRTFGMERIALVRDLSKATGHPPQDLVRALRGVPLEQVAGFLALIARPAIRAWLDRLVEEERA